jgi:twinkle protein
MSTPDNLRELLAEHGIRLKNYGAGRTERLRCPRCDGGRSREDCLAVTIDPDGEGAVWVCHRGKCAWTDGAHLPRRGGEQAWRKEAQPEREVIPPTPHHAGDMRRPEELYAWFRARGISQETVDLFGCYVTTKGFRQPGNTWLDKDAIVFPYLFEGRLVNRKYRSAEKELMQDRSPLPTLFNIDAVAADDMLIWVEGEPDVMAVHEAGYPQVVTLKDGSSKRLLEEDDPRRHGQKRYLALGTHAERLNRIEKHILAGDGDEPGKALREEMARRLGRHRCWFVTWPEGCKDAGDVLRLHGPERVRQCIEAAQPYPIEGVYRIQAGDLVALRNQGRPPVLSTGTSNTDAIMALPSEGRLIVITGIPNHGKSTWAMFVKAHIMEHHQRRFAIFSPEMEPWKRFVAHMASVLWKKPFYRSQAGDELTDAELGEAEAYLNPRVAMLVADPDKEDQAPTLDWLLERAKLEVLRSGVTDLFIDPWNELEHRRSREFTETEYVGRCLQRLRAFMRRHSCNVWIVAHPTKLHPEKPGKKVSPPSLYDIAGSANWANKADLGVTVHTEDGVTQIHLTKARFQEWGRRGSVAYLELDQRRGVYSNAAVPLPGEDE